MSGRKLVEHDGCDVDVVGTLLQVRVHFRDEASSEGKVVGKPITIRICSI